jgi:hypothetical protein
METENRGSAYRSRPDHGRRGSGARARVPDDVIDELRSREHNGLIVLPKKPQLAPGADFRSTIA